MSICKLGKGFFGSVFKKKTDGQEFACKAIKVDHGFDLIYNELNVLEKIKNTSHVLHYTEAYTVALKTKESTCTKTTLYICSDYIDAESLYKTKNEWIGKHVDIAVLTAQALIGLVSLHELKIIHRDIKPENILVEMDAEHGKHQLTIIDFGLSI